MSDTTRRKIQSKPPKSVEDLVGNKRVTLDEVSAPNPLDLMAPTGLPPVSDLLAQLVRNLFYQDIKQRPLFKALGTQTIGTTEVAVVHGLKRAPNVVIVQMTSAGGIYQSTAADATKIYLKADSAGRTCNVEVAYIPDNLI